MLIRQFFFKNRPFGAIMCQNPPICDSIFGGFFLFLHPKFRLLKCSAVSWGSKILRVEAKNAVRIPPCEAFGDQTEDLAPKKQILPYQHAANSQSVFCYL